MGGVCISFFECSWDRLKKRMLFNIYLFFAYYLERSRAGKGGKAGRHAMLESEQKKRKFFKSASQVRFL